MKKSTILLLVLCLALAAIMIFDPAAIFYIKTGLLFAKENFLSGLPASWSNVLAGILFVGGFFTWLGSVIWMASGKSEDKSAAPAVVGIIIIFLAVAILCTFTR
ncbi:MAG: hypothetical protein AAB568_03500 [Patescibacteria group bacterium]